ncbi:uncharacterized protein LOC116300092 isoform X3 [Actinia tenebrosa]|uniref:Uncharacterized protein LOC116300092 isoform X3 n=1 Tax=Actinia tenebrosa TaxID=6105 RepID=A0A6P8IET7_ACTTE|nr:uncharacterized protein LOC116300092 isoform X3 [Actinia tenebrosa]
MFHHCVQSLGLTDVVLCSTIRKIAVMGTFIFAKVRGYSILAHWSLNGTEQGLSSIGLQRIIVSSTGSPNKVPVYGL